MLKRIYNFCPPPPLIFKTMSKTYRKSKFPEEGFEKVFRDKSKKKNKVKKRFKKIEDDED